MDTYFNSIRALVKLHISKPKKERNWRKYYFADLDLSIHDNYDDEYKI